MTVSKDRIDWKRLEQDYAKWQQEGHWIEGMFWFGFDVTHSWTVGTETMLIAMIEEPEWVEDMFDTYLDRSIQHFNMIWDAGYRFDSIFWYDDMGYQEHPLLLQRDVPQPAAKVPQKGGGLGPRPRHLRPAPLLRRHHAPAARHHGHRHRCVKPHRDQAGMDVFKIKQDYGDRLVLHRGASTRCCGTTRRPL